MFLLFLERKFMIKLLLKFPTPISSNIWWNLGFLILIMVLVQIVSGLLLSCFIDINKNCLFSKFVLYKDINLGWVIVLIHIIIPHILFLFIYLHILKSYIFPIYNYFLLWFSGFVLLILFISIVFTGYSLVFSAMGFWALTVCKQMISLSLGDLISNILIYTDVIGITKEVLSKIFTYHYLISFISCIIIFKHINILHKGGNSNQFFSYCDLKNFTLILIWKDLLIGIFIIFITISLLGYFSEEFMIGGINVTLENVLTTEITVEWYVRIYFMILRLINGRYLGIILIIIYMILLSIIPIIKNLWNFLVINPLNFNILKISFLIVLLKISYYVFGSYLIFIPIILWFLFIITLDRFLLDFYYIKHYYL